MLRENLFLRKSDFRMRRSDLRMRRSDFRMRKSVFFALKTDFRMRKSDFRKKTDFRVTYILFLSVMNPIFQVLDSFDHSRHPCVVVKCS